MTLRIASWLCLSAFAVLMVGASGAGNRTPRVVFNASPSLPTGFYSVHQLERLAIGDLVVVRVPEAFDGLVTERRYLPRGVPLIKRVAALSGDDVCSRDGLVFLNGRPLVRALERDGMGRPMPVWHGCRRLLGQEFFAAIQEVETSLDSRYLGPLDRDLILGKAEPFWIFDP